MTMRVVRGTVTNKVFAVVGVLGLVMLALLPSWGSVSLQRKMVEEFGHVVDLETEDSGFTHLLDALGRVPPGLLAKSEADLPILL